jgi:hypothetical protein
VESVKRNKTTDWLSDVIRTYATKMKTNDKFILTAKMLLDTGAVVSIAPKKQITKLLDKWLRDSKLRVLTASGDTEGAGGEI